MESVDLKPFIFNTTFIIAEPPSKILVYHEPKNWKVYKHPASMKKSNIYYIRMDRAREVSDYLVKSNISVIKYEPFEILGNKVKSSKIKQFITNGDVSSAKMLLGRAFSLDGKIIKGNKKGREIGYPTANLDLHDIQQIIPKVGVYSVNFLRYIHKQHTLLACIHLR